MATTKGVCYATTNGGITIEYMLHCDLGPEGYASTRSFSMSQAQLTARFGSFMEAVEVLFAWCALLDYFTLFAGSELGYELTETVEQYQQMLEQIDAQATAPATNTETVQ